MTFPLAAVIAIPLILIAIWAINARRTPKEPESTPWADSTQIAKRQRGEE